MDIEKGDEKEKEKEGRQMNTREKEDEDGKKDKQIKTGRENKEQMKKEEEEKDRQTKIMKENEKETKNNDENRKTHRQGEKTRKQGKAEQEEKKKEEQEEEEDRFKDIFKYYKRRKPPPDLTQAIDADSCCVEVQTLPVASEQDKAMAHEVGLTPPHTWTVHHLINHPGLVVVRNPFTQAGQLAWASQCLRDMARPPHKTNLASHGIHLEGRSWWQLCRTEEGRRSGLREKLRWVTLGYHHDWDTKEYSEDNRSDMPDSVVRLCGVVARVLGLCVGGGGGEFKAQAGIINYYHHHSTLSPHTDHSEPYMEAPLLSFSFGQSAVFLIGGCTKATAPSAILLHSGDIVVMAGAARLCYHAVPRILLQAERRKKKEEEEEELWALEFGEFKTWRKKRKVEEKQGEETVTPEMMQKPKKSKQHKDTDDSAADDDSDLPDILHYLRTCRINMNIRQVLPPSMDVLPS